MTNEMPEDGPDSNGDEYGTVRPGKIRLKETKQDKAHRLYRREQRRHQRDSERIARANGLPLNPTGPSQLDDDDAPPRSAKADAKLRDTDDHIEYLLRPDAHQRNGEPSSAPQHVPSRFRSAATAGSYGEGKRKRDATQEVSLDGGGVPDIGEMSEAEYSTWVRSGMERLRTRAETSARAAEKREREEREHRRTARKEAEAKAARRKEKAEAKRLEKEVEEQREKLRIQADEAKRAERRRYRDKWKALLDVGGEVEMSELRVEDVPWPIYRGSRAKQVEQLEIVAVGDFLRDLGADEEGSEKDRMRKVLREAIRAFHPDRFFGRILPRVRGSDQQKVRETVELCSRILNELAEKSRLL